MSSREAFEEWAKKEGYRVFSNARGSYDMPSTNCTWEAWQAATERAAKVCDELRNKIPWVAETQDRIDTAQCCAVEIREGND